MKKMRLAGAALNQTPLNWKENLSNIRQAIFEAEKENADILCLPELCITGYGCEDLFLSNWLPEKALNKLVEIIPLVNDCFTIVGLPIRFEGKTYNCAAAIYQQELLGLYCKQWLADEGVHYEPRWFSPWPSGVMSNIEINSQFYPIGDITINHKGIKIGFEICEDAWRGELRPGYKLKEKGVDLILNPSASHFAFGKSNFREHLIVDSSKLFDCVYLYSNLLGNETGRMIFDGEVFIAQKGKLIQKNRRLSFQSVNLVTAEVDFTGKYIPQELAYDDQDKYLEFDKAIALALFDYLRKSRSKCFVLSLSGGADSACCAIMVAEMVRRGVEDLGIDGFVAKAGIPDRKFKSVEDITDDMLYTAYQATKNSSEDTYLAAKEIAESVGATFYSWNIDDVVSDYTNIYENTTGEKLTWEDHDIPLQNIQARSRAPMIWLLTNVKGGLLLATSNRSEGDVGYATMDGDTSGSISPIAGVDKTFIRNWLKWAEKERGFYGLNRVNNLAPTAELRPSDKNQTDESDLMPYHILAKIEREAIFQRKAPIEVYQSLKEADLCSNKELKRFIIKFFRLWSINQWKRERFAPSFHLDEFNVDPKTWCRFPILSGAFSEEIEELVNINPDDE
ncbi:NAD(+) synthase [Marinigracilibium pacificum]|uniref:Glutamine-dependent NAD(+) synthetase n=1 Tax=Marinigracilibium pacificum TaxID=2729599 RepID=A0A848J3P0_9BACT|nr:NAD(+) synthase [Marinigracilibium pacificum]NMM49150.1 NAD(+) synthase [Marinigracilibium pacificum]